MNDTSTCAHCVRQITAGENSWVDDQGETTCPVLGGPHFPAARNVTWPAKIMTTRWTAMPNDLIGGWCVMAGNKPPSAAREPEVADFVTREAAEHIADLHNKWLMIIKAMGPGRHQ